MPKLICIDADDTLWHNMRFFAAAEAAFRDLVRPFAEAGVAMAALVACERRNLPHYGYGAKGFTLSLIEAAAELAGPALPAATVTAILEAGRELLRHPVELLDGVADALDALAALAPLLLVTKGDLLHQEAKLAASGLGERFAGVEIVSDKTPATYRGLAERHGIDPGALLMIGDSLRSDVAPALEAGAWAAWVPQPGAWAHEAAPEPDRQPRFRRFERLSDVPAWAAAIG